MSHPEIPEVWASDVDDLVVVELAPNDATVLAKILAHYDALVTQDPSRGVADGYTPEVWHHTLIRLLSARAKLTTPAATDQINVPNLSRHLRAVGAAAGGGHR